MVVAHVILDTMMMEIILHANNAIAIAKNVIKMNFCFYFINNRTLLYFFHLFIGFAGDFSNCSSCRTSDNRTLVGNTCVCLDRFFDDSGTCKNCDHSCLSCNGLGSNNCVTCSSTGKIYLEK